MIDLLMDGLPNWNTLVSVMRILRSPEGCVWDREQTHESIRANLLEESYEALEAIELHDTGALCEELGDVLLQVVFHAQMAAEHGDFSIDDVIAGICTKLITRHPHVFGQSQVKDSQEVLAQWDQIKRQTKGQTQPLDPLRAVPSTLPALMKAGKLISRAGKAKLIAPTQSGSMTQDELGDELFDLVKRACASGLDAEQALLARCRRFVDELS